MPNLEYYYDKDGILNDKILNDIDDIVDIEGDNDTEIISENYCVVFRDEFGKLKKRKAIKGDRNLGQFVYVPANFTTNGSLANVFNFRYNLPKHWELPAKFDKTTEGGAVTQVEYYKSTYDFNNAISIGELDTTILQYHSQYYFITDKSVKWDNIFDAKNVFISSDQDIDFSNDNIMGKQREYYIVNDEMSNEQKNTWTNDKKVSNAAQWVVNNKNFHVDLNLCGKKNDYNMLEDNGCPVIIENRSVHLDNFVSGILTIFLNGRVFDDTFVVDKLRTDAHKSSGGSPIIGYQGFGKNIILPRFNATPLDEYIVVIPIDSEFYYYDFMVDNEATTISNYKQYLAKDMLSGGKQLFETTYNKYTFK